MPPVFGPSSPSPARLKSWAGWSGTTVVAVGDREQRHLGAVEELLDDDAAAGLRVRAAPASRSSVTTTPLPAARPSSLTTYGAPNASSAAATSSGGRADVARAAVGTPAAAMTSFANALEPSSCAAAPRRAEARRCPRARTASATPATSGASGPTTTRSAPSSRGERGDGRAVERRRPGAVRGDLRDAGVAGRAVQRGDVGVEGQGAAQGVFAGAAADDEDLHGGSLRPPCPGGPAGSGRGTGGRT